MFSVFLQVRAFSLYNNLILESTTYFESEFTGMVGLTSYDGHWWLDLDENNPATKMKSLYQNRPSLSVRYPYFKYVRGSK